VCPSLSTTPVCGVIRSTCGCECHWGSQEGQSRPGKAECDCVSSGKSLPNAHHRCRCDSLKQPDGREKVDFYLIDSNGDSHLAVYGVADRHNDGYQYNVCLQEAQSLTDDLEYTYQGVWRWLERHFIKIHSQQEQLPAPSTV
jgi:hypothetical protein